jgi:hypothetical protein
MTNIFSGRGFQSSLKNLSRQKYVNRHEKGIQIKNKISSNGSFKILIPVIYFSLNHQTPIFVNHASQIIKTEPTIKEAEKNAPKCLLNFIL